MRRAVPNPKPVAIDPLNDIAVLQYTGGTTGTPKGAMLTHANLTCNTRQVMMWAPDLGQGQERVMGVLPFFHVFAMTVVLNFGIAKAAEIVMMPRFTLDEGLGPDHQGPSDNHAGRSDAVQRHSKPPQRSSPSI